MATRYRKEFDLGLADLEIIEVALRDQVRQLGEEKLGQLETSEQAAAENFKQLDAQILAIQDVLGKLHNQKSWYTPKEYVPRG